jgi:hypothetical protein
MVGLMDLSHEIQDVSLASVTEIVGKRAAVFARGNRVARNVRRFLIG